MKIICRKCGQPWKLEPRKWRNNRFVTKKSKTYRIMICPICSAKNLVDVKDIEKIKKEKKLVVLAR